MNISQLLTSLNTAKRMSPNHIKVLITQMALMAGMEVNYNGTVKTPVAPRDRAADRLAFFATKKAAAKMRIETAIEVGTYNGVTTIKFRCNPKADQTKVLETMYNDTYMKHVKKGNNKPAEFAEQLERLRLALLIGPSPELTEVVTKIQTDYISLFKKKLT